jgi:broad specificity phosphatase PhoE
MKKVYFVRHGETSGNLGGFWQSPQEPLNEKGRNQAAALADRFKSFSFDRIFVSTMNRARETADVITSNMSTEKEYSDLFAENKDPSSVYSKNEVTAPHDVIERFRKERQEFGSNPEWHFEDEENMSDFMTRIVTAKDFLTAQPETNILVVSHGNFIRCLAGHVVTNGKYSIDEASEFRHRFKTINTGVTVFLVDDNNWQLLTWNDHAHFAE